MNEITRALVLSAAQGDQQAIADLYERSYSSVYKSLRAMVSDEELVLDILQDSYIKAFRSLHQLEDPGSFLPWLKRIAANKARDHFKKTRPTLFSDLSEEGDAPELRDVAPGHDPEAVLDRKETVRLMQEILDSLPQDQRMAIALYYFEEKGVKEIALLLDCSETAVKSRLAYGRKKVEAKVLTLEKQGVKLYSLAPMPFLLWLFRQELAVAPSAGILQAVTAQCAAGSAAGTASGTAGLGAAKVSLTAKIAAGVAVAAVTVGAVALVTNQAPDYGPRDIREYSHELVLEDYRSMLSPKTGEYVENLRDRESSLLNDALARYHSGEELTFYIAREDLDGNGVRELLLGAGDGGEVEILEIAATAGTAKPVAHVPLICDRITLYTDGTARLEGEEGTSYCRFVNNWLRPGAPTDAPELSPNWEKLDLKGKRPDWAEVMPGIPRDRALRPHEQSVREGMFLLGPWALDFTRLDRETAYVVLTNLVEDTVLWGLPRQEGDSWVFEWEGTPMRITFPGEGLLILEAQHSAAGSYTQLPMMPW